MKQKRKISSTITTRKNKTKTKKLIWKYLVIISHCHTTTSKVSFVYCLWLHYTGSRRSYQRMMCFLKTFTLVGKKELEMKSEWQMILRIAKMPNACVVVVALVQIASANATTTTMLLLIVWFTFDRQLIVKLLTEMNFLISFWQLLIAVIQDFAHFDFLNNILFLFPYRICILTLRDLETIKTSN